MLSVPYTLLLRPNVYGTEKIGWDLTKGPTIAHDLFGNGGFTYVSTWQRCF